MASRTTCVLFQGNSDYICIGAALGGGVGGIDGINRNMTKFSGHFNDTYNHWCVTNNNGLQCNGQNGYGQLGDGTNTSRSSLVTVEGSQ